MSWTFYSQSNIAAGGNAPVSSTISSDFTFLTQPVKIVDGIAANTSKIIYSYGGPHDIIDVFIISMFGPDGEQIPLGAVAQNTHCLLTRAKNNLGKTTVTLQIPAAGVAIPANGTVVLYIVAGDSIKLNPPNL